MNQAITENTQRPNRFVKKMSDLEEMSVRIFNSYLLFLLKTILLLCQCRIFG